MRFEFVHAADIHLGNEQYNLDQRFDDFAKAYFAMVDYAIDHRVDFVLIAGDLFHQARTDARTLNQAVVGLERLHGAGIPVIAIEGNHDVQHYYKNLSWMEFLVSRGLLMLLDKERAESGLIRLVPYDREREAGSWIDVAGARVYGLKYHGVATSRLLEDLADDIEPGPGGYTIFMLHQGMQGQVPHLHGGLTSGQLGPLLPAVDYIALGHVHKRLQEDPVFNPGSLETNSVDEAEWEHGFFHVRVDTERKPKHQITAVSTPGLRQFHRIVATSDGTETLEEYVRKVEAAVAKAANIGPGSVIELQLSGTAGFRRQDVPLESIKAAIEIRHRPLTVRIRNSLAPPGIVQRSSYDRTTRADLEEQTVRQIVGNSAEHRDQREAWTRLILDVKNMASEKDLPANVADRVRTSLQAMAEDPPTPGALPQDDEAAAPELPLLRLVPDIPEDSGAPKAKEFAATDGSGDSW
jgi:DNA repair exonuclease SbcCD nuclease subunit